MKVVLALDGSAPSLIARDLAVALPWPAGTTIHLVAAYQLPLDWTAGMAPTGDWITEAESATREHLEDELRTHAEPLTKRGLGTERHVVPGRAANAISGLAAEVDADLVITGSRGRGQVRSMLLGSVAAEIAAEAPCSVLVARGASISRLLVAGDGSSGANIIPEELGRWDVFRDHPAHAVAVSIPDSAAFERLVGLYTLGDERLAGKRRELRRRYQADAEAMAQQLTAIGIPATPELRAGDPAREILAAADELGSDLIVTGSRGRSGLERMLLGSVARNVLTHARCSVLIVRRRSSGSY